MGETWKRKHALADMMDSYTNYGYGLHDQPENQFVEFDITLTEQANLAAPIPIISEGG